MSIFPLRRPGSDHLVVIGGSRAHILVTWILDFTTSIAHLYEKSKLLRFRVKTCVF